MVKSSEQTGRSMIEMLGVLAIVGVLSVAGIMGFNAAMEKYKIEKVREEMHTISANLMMLYHNESNYAGLNNDLAKQLGVIPDNMIKSGTVRNAFGGDVEISAVDYGGVENGAFKVEFKGLPPKVSVQLGTDGGNEINKNLMYVQIKK